MWPIQGVGYPATGLPDPASRRRGNGSNESVSPGQAETTATVPNGPQLFGRYCAACHSENGDGNGLAARFLYPKPRNFREGHFRLVTTTNRIPSDEDLMHVVVRGMPGSAMFPLGHLGEPERKELVAHVRQLIRDGLEDQLRREAKEFGEVVVPAELAKTLDTRTQPGSILTADARLGFQRLLAEVTSPAVCRTEAGSATAHSDEWIMSPRMVDPCPGA